MCIDSYADISIHTPTRGTTAGTGTATNLAEFQSTFPREERPYYTIVRIQVLQFQSTLPREERPFPTDFVTAFMPYFNPRSHERSDFTGDYTFEVTLISIHAPTRGATHNAGTVGTAKEFQYTLPREERPILQGTQRWRSYFAATLGGGAGSRRGSGGEARYFVLSLARSKVTVSFSVSPLRETVSVALSPAE